MNILVIDNYDSFIYNFIDSLQGLGHHVAVLRNSVSLQQVRRQIELINAECILISPGPGNPEQAGICLELVAAYAGNLPIIGICLGHQVLAAHFGGTIEQDEVPVHGKRSRIKVEAEHSLFNGIEGPVYVGRYHSLKVTQLPQNFDSIAHAESTLMAMADDELGLLGIQFHPESILTSHGEQLIANCISYAQQQYKKLSQEVAV